MKIGVIGGGTVGRAVARTYLEFVDEVRVYDIEPRLSTTSTIGECLHQIDLAFVCLPTPQNPMGGGLDVSTLERFFSDCKNTGWSDVNYVLKSTVPVGTTRRLAQRYSLPNLVHSPEFLTARCAEVDARIPVVNVIGNPGGAVMGNSLPCYDVLYDLYERRFPGIQTIGMTSDESEAAKLCLNTAFAVKVALFNELWSFCDVLGCDWEMVRRVMLADGRITAHHTQVPGPDSKRGFGGTCLPKDLAQFIAQSLEIGEPCIVADAAEERNKLDRGVEL